MLRICIRAKPLWTDVVWADEAANGADGVDEGANGAEGTDGAAKGEQQPSLGREEGGVLRRGQLIVIDKGPDFLIGLAAHP